MIVTVDDHEELTDVVGWVYLTNKWSIGQARIVIHNLGDISYPQLKIKMIDGLNLHIEVLTFRQLIKNASERHNPFFNKLFTTH
jgi:hypothetical protein